MTTTCTLSCEGVPREDPETGEPCAACTAELEREMAYHRRQYAAASPAERDPEGYARDMRDAGRGHLLREDER